MDDWVWWVVAALALAAVEIATLDLIFGMIAVGALAAAVAAALGAPVLVQVLIAAAVAMLLLFAVRPIALSHLRSSPQATTNVDALVGAPARVLQRVDEHQGLVKIGGEDWSARAVRSGQVFPPGSALTVVRIEGATAVVDQARDPAPTDG